MLLLSPVVKVLCGINPHPLALLSLSPFSRGLSLDASDYQEVPRFLNFFREVFGSVPLPSASPASLSGGLSLDLPRFREVPRFFRSFQIFREVFGKLSSLRLPSGTLL